MDYTSFNFHPLPLSVFGLSLRITPSINTAFGSCTLASHTVRDSYQNKQYILYIILIYTLSIIYIYNNIYMSLRLQINICAKYNVNVTWKRKNIYWGLESGWTPFYLFNYLFIALSLHFYRNLFSNLDFYFYCMVQIK